MRSRCMCTPRSIPGGWMWGLVAVVVMLAVPTAWGAENVQDHGAKGDGVTDDTQAIQAAVQAAAKKRRITQHPKYGYFVTLSEVYFPSGHYLISEPIDVSYVRLRGEHYAAIEQMDAEKDLFVARDAWRQVIEGLTFLGGATQLNLGNDNVDTGHVTIRDCHFKNSSGPAVQMRKNSRSTFFKIENSVFINCEQVLVNHCDLAVMRDCWISTSARMRDKAVIENRGVLHIEHLLGVPRVRRGEDGYSVEWVDPSGAKRTASNQRWVDNHHVLQIRHSRLGGEGGGFAAVWNFAAFRHQYPVEPNMVRIENSYLYHAQDAAVVLKEIPNILTVTDCSGMNDAWVVRVDPALDLDTYFTRQGRRYEVNVRVENNQGARATGLPRQLQPVVEVNKDARSQ